MKRNLIATFLLLLFPISQKGSTNIYENDPRFWSPGQTEDAVRDLTDQTSTAGDVNSLTPTITVTNTDDSGAGSLRQAIIDANANADADVIGFNIPGSGVHTISVTTGLPFITHQVTIDGYTQSGSSPNTLDTSDNAVLQIVLNGSATPVGTNGLVLEDANIAVRGLVINGFKNHGIIMLTTGTDNCSIQGNFIGTDPTGMTAVPNGGDGVNVNIGSGHVIGGIGPAERNIIAGNTGRGIFFNTGPNSVAGNFIGVGADGHTAIGNGMMGVFLSGSTSGITIGGTTPGARNIISANDNEGIAIHGSGHLIQGNYVGTDSTGTLDVGNWNITGTGGGISISGGATVANILIGGPSPSARNVISGSGNGITLNTASGIFISNTGTNIVIQGNYIGTAANGTDPIPNDDGGISLANGPASAAVTIGGQLSGEGNIIAFNGGSGVSLDTNLATPATAIRGNSIHSNASLGIDIFANGTLVNVNDDCDPDGGPNLRQNYPVLTSATNSATSTRVRGFLNSAVGSIYKVDWYACPSCDMSGNGEGKTWIGWTPVAIDGSTGCQVSFEVPLSMIPAGQFLTATATDPLGNTSEFSACLIVSPNKTPFDFDGDGKTDIGITRPNGGITEWWISRSSDSNLFSTVFGVDSDISAPGDFTGDGKADIAVFRPSTGFWYVLRSEDFSYTAFPFGSNGDIPMPADFDGDGKTDPAVFRPSGATWFINRSSDGQTTIAQFGAPGDQPVAADYDGDGKADIAVYRQNNGAQEWWIQRSTAGLFATVFGASGDKAVAGDYTGDGKTDIAVWRPANGDWYILRSEDFSYLAFPWGANGDLPAPGDYDGDGKTDAAVFRQSSATWFINRTGGSGPLITGFGLSGDAPVPSSFVR